MNIAIVVMAACPLNRLRARVPDLPRCTEDSYVLPSSARHPRGDRFGNRLFTLVLVIAAARTFVSAVLYGEDGRPRRDLRC